MLRLANVKQYDKILGRFPQMEEIENIKSKKIEFDIVYDVH